jgi:hypothetical protein
MKLKGLGLVIITANSIILLSFFASLIIKITSCSFRGITLIQRDQIMSKYPCNLQDKLLSVVLIFLAVSALSSTVLAYKVIRQKT